MTTDDATVVRQVIAGSVGEFRTLVERHQGPVYRFVLGLLGHRQEAEDVTQDAFLAAFRSLAKFDPGRARFSTWLFTIARNLAINRYRKELPHRKLAELTAVEVRNPPDGRTESTESLAQIDRALDTLPLEQKTVFVLAEIEQLAHAEIAHIEGIAVGTVKSRLSRAKGRLRVALRDLVSES